MISDIKIHDFGGRFGHLDRRKIEMGWQQKFESIWTLIYGYFLQNLAIENEGSATAMYDVAKCKLRCVCALRIAQNYCKLQWFVKVRMCGRSRLEVKCSSKSLRKPLHI